VHSQQCTLAFSEIPQPYEYLYKLVTGNFLFKRFFDNCDVILPISNFIKNSLSQLYHVSEQKMTVMPNAIDCNKVKFSRRGRERFREENDIDGLFIFSAGRLIKEKGFHYLISAISRMEEKDDIILGIAGEGYFDKNLIRLAKSLDVNLKLFGFLKGQNLYDAFSASDIFVTPSIWDEAFGIVNIEAMACERPVIASKSGGIPEVITDNRTGLLYDRFDLDQFVDKLNILADDSSLRKKMGKEGRKRVNKHYSWDILTEEWIKVYSSLN
jgi:glycosyltransferase involved in cell wall biosynthesis